MTAKRVRRTPITASLLAELVVMYASGLSLRDLVEAYGTSYGNTRDALLDAGVVLRRPGSHVRHPRSGPDGVSDRCEAVVDGSGRVLAVLRIQPDAPDGLRAALLRMVEAARGMAYEGAL